MSTDDPQQPPRRNGEPVAPGDDVILSEATAVPGHQEPAPAPVTTLTPHDLATPYVLDALTPDEREAYEEHLAGCESCRIHVVELQAVAGLLPDALVAPPADLPDAYPYLLRDVAHETLPFTATSTRDDDNQVDVAENQEDESGEPGHDLTGDLTTPFDAEGEHAGSDVTADVEPEPLPLEDEGEYQSLLDEDTDDERDETATPLDEADLVDDDEETAELVSPQAARMPRPPGRIRPGVRPTTAAVTSDAVAARSEPGTGFRASPLAIVCVLLGVIAIGLFLWALLLQGRVNDLEDEVAAQNAELASLRQQANATAYTLLPTADGPSGASGTFFFSLPDQRGALVVRGLDAPPDGQAYQIWYIEDGAAAPVSGVTFQPNGAGEAVVPLSAEVTTFDAVAISLEPGAGSDAPTTPYLLQGRLGGAAG